MAYVTQKIALPVTPSSSSKESSPHNLLLSSNKYGMVIFAINSTVYISSVSEVENASKTLTNLFSFPPLNSPILGLSLSQDNLTLLCFSSNTLLFYSLTSLESYKANKGEIKADFSFSINGSILACKYSASSLSNGSFFILDDRHTLSIYPTGPSFSSSPLVLKVFPGCKYADWDSHHHRIVLSFNLTFLLLNAEDLSVILTTTPSLPSEFIQSVNYLSWCPYTQNNDQNYFLVGFNCAVMDEEEDKENKEETLEDTFISMSILRWREKSQSMDVVNYFEDVCQPVNESEEEMKGQQQTFFSSYLSPT